MRKGQRVIVKGERGTTKGFSNKKGQRRKIRIRFDNGDCSLVEKDSIELIEPRKDIAAIEARFEKIRNSKVLVYWAGDKEWYPAKVVGLLAQSGELRVIYDDGEDKLYTHLDFSDYALEPNGYALVWKPDRLEKEQQGQDEQMKDDQDLMEMDDSENSDGISTGRMRSFSNASLTKNHRKSRIRKQENVAGEEENMSNVTTKRGRNTGVNPTVGRSFESNISSSSGSQSSKSRSKTRHALPTDEERIIFNADQHRKQQLNKEKIGGNEEDVDYSDDFIHDLTKDDDDDVMDCVDGNGGGEAPSSPEPIPTPPAISLRQLRKGTRIEIWWHGDRRWYEGKIMQTPLSDEQIRVHYKDGENIWESMRDKRGRVCMRLVMPKDKIKTVNQKIDMRREKMDALGGTMIATHSSATRLKGKNAKRKLSNPPKQKIRRKKLKIPKKAGVKKKRTTISNGCTSGQAQINRVRSLANDKIHKPPSTNFNRFSNGRNSSHDRVVNIREKVESHFRIRTKAHAPWVAVKLPENPNAPPMDPRPWRLK